MVSVMSDDSKRIEPARAPAMGCFGLTSDEFERLNRARGVARRGQTASYSAAMMRALKPRPEAA
jgi:hypothetical protein